MLEAKEPSNRQRVRHLVMRAGMAGVSLLVLFGLLLTDMAPVAEAAKPGRDRADGGRITIESVEAGDAERRAGRPSVGIEIVGGEPVPQGTHTFATYIQVEVSEGLYTGCTGSLVTPRHVVTAAHCVEEEGLLYTASQFTLAVGRASLIGVPAANIFTVEEVAAHRAWDPVNLTNDIAVLTLKQTVPAEIAQPISLVARNGTRLEKPGRRAVTAGWGYTVGGGVGSPDLLQISTTIARDAVCDIFAGFDLDGSSKICAKVPEKSTCNGDSGGPLFVLPTTSKAARQGSGADQTQEIRAEGKKHKKRKKRKNKRKNKNRRKNTITEATLIGVTSFGISGCPPGGPNVFTQLSAPVIHDFVMESINE